MSKIAYLALDVHARNCVLGYMGRSSDLRFTESEFFGT